MRHRGLLCGRRERPCIPGDRKRDHAEAKTNLEAKVNELQAKGLKVSYLTPNNLIAICTHGWSGIDRRVLGKVTERVVRHSGDPVLIIR